MRIKILFLLFFFFLAVTNVFADTILLKSGQQVEGKILEQTKDSIKLDIEGIALTYYISDIDSINGQKVVEASPNSTDPTTAAGTQEEYPAQMQNENVNIQTGSEVRESTATEANSIDKEIPSTENINSLTQEKEIQDESQKADSEYDSSTYPSDGKSSKASLTPEQTNLAVGIFAGIFLIILIVSVVVYVYSSICLYLIAQKTATEPAWLAWVPIGNLFLMCKVGQVNYLWLLPLPIPVLIGFIFGLAGGLSHSKTAALGLMAMMIPLQIIFILILTAVFAFIWYKIALARNKPSWIGILMGATTLLGIFSFLPGGILLSFLGTIVNLILMGYLAFSE